MFFRKKENLSGVEYIVAGLGNPDRKYENTRHNAGFITADAEALFNDAITASLQQYGINNSTAYLQQSSVAYDATAWAERIGWQKWIAYYGQGPDAFTDLRRLGYPQLQPGP